MNKDNQAQAHQQDITQEVSQDKVVDINNDQQKRERGALPLLEKVNEISIKSMTDEEERHLDALIRTNGGATLLYKHIKAYSEQFSELAVRKNRKQVIPSVETFYDYHSVNTMNVLAYFMKQVEKKYGESCIFIKASYIVEQQKEDGDNKSKEKYIVKSHSYTVNLKRLANYMVDVHYRDTVFASKNNESSGNGAYYLFDLKKGRWDIASATSLKRKIIKEVSTLLDGLGFEDNVIIKMQHIVFNEIIGLLEEHLDYEDDMLEEYTKLHPNLVQFNDIIYDIDTHKVAVSHPNFKLKQVHEYDLPLGSLDKACMVQDGETFYALPLTKEAVMQQSTIMVERFKVLLEEGMLNFMFTYLGACFYHDVLQFQTAIALRGGAGTGKSFLISEIIGSHMYGRYVSAINQRKLESNSNFIYSALVHKEINIIGEMNASAMPDSMVDMFKSVQSGDLVDIEFKGKNSYQSKVYSRTIMLSNENQLPPIRTNRVNDSGLRRRLVVIDCNKKGSDTTWSSKFEKNDLIAVIPAFALLCMMVFKENKANGNIRKFHHLEGASEVVIDNFTTKEMVNSTRKYFNSHDRYRLFLNELPYIFIRQMEQLKGFGNENNDLLYFDKLTEENFKTWLAYSKATFITNEFKDWHEQEFITKKGKADFEKFLTDKDVIKKNRKIPNTKKSIRCFGLEFAQLVTETCLKDNRESYLDALSDETF